MGRFRAVVVLVVVCVVLAVGSAGAVTLKLTVPWDRTYLYWTSVPKQGGAAEQSPADRFKGKTAKIDLPEAKGSIALTVYDTTTGNAAVETLKPPINPKGLALQKDDFDEVRRVQIKITADRGKPVETALVTLTDVSGRVQKARVDPTTSGVAEFTDVTAGDAKVQVAYGEGKSASQDVTIPEERDTPIFSTEVPVAGPVETLAAQKPGVAASESEEAEKPAGASGTQWILALIGSLVGLVVLAGIGVVVYLVLRQKGVTLEKGLQKVGVELPQGTPAPGVPAPGQPAAPMVDTGVCPFCGQQKDPVTGQCACTVAPAAAATPSSGPRLVRVQGASAASVYEITSEVTTIGREADNSIALPLDTAVSRHHSRIAREAGDFVIYDAGSSNGTFVNSEKVTQQTLRSGDEIQVGTTRLRFET